MKRALGMVLLIGLIPGLVQAAVLTSPHYRIDPNIGSSFGGTGSSTDYKLTDAGGEAAIGNASSSSYRLSAGYIAGLAQSLQLTIVPNGLAAYYPLDTGVGGQIYDVSTNNNQGVLTGAPSWNTGKLGQSLSLNGTTQYASIPSSSSLSLTGDMTVSAWVNISNYTNTQDVVSKRVGTGSTNTNYELRIQQSTGQLQFLAYDTALRTVTGTTPVPLSAWTQIVAVSRSGLVTLYLNGAAISTPTAVASTTTNTNPVRLGTTDDVTNFLSGGLDEVKIYNRALSLSEVTADYSAVNAGIATGQVLPSVVPGVSQVTTNSAVVRTDAPSYTMSIMENHDLLHTDGTTSIPAVSGTITTPTAWSEGSTKGLGFTLTAGSQLETSWGTSPTYNYAALPLTSTTFHSVLGFSGGAANSTTLQYRLDAPTTQKSGSYSNTVTITATLKP